MYFLLPFFCFGYILEKGKLKKKTNPQTFHCVAYFFDAMFKIANLISFFLFLN